jgi:3-dehydroquinate synthase
LIPQKFSPDKCIVVTDSNVGRIYTSGIKSAFLSSKDHRSFVITIPAGEKSKSQKVRDKLEREIIKLNPSRQSLLIAFGGGVVGDITGFAASTILRGIKYIQVPTTIISQVDSSIGGKTGINLNESKNLIGTIYQPSHVLIDINFLKTLPEEEYLNGIAEIVKSFLIADVKAFGYLEINLYNLLKREPKALQYCIEHCVELKRKIVEKDENEIGFRKILNFGHTIGHAIEALSNYHIKHGFAVAEGMLVESQISNQLGRLRGVDLKKIQNIIEKLGLDKKLRHKYEFNSIWEKISFDKKKAKDGIGFSLLSKIGKCEYNIFVDKSVVKSAFKK